MVLVCQARLLRVLKLAGVELRRCGVRCRYYVHRLSLTRGEIRRGWQMIFCFSPSIALALLRARPPERVLLLPNICGSRFTRSLLSRSGTPTLPNEPAIQRSTLQIGAPPRPRYKFTRRLTGEVCHQTTDRTRSQTEPATATIMGLWWDIRGCENIGQICDRTNRPYPDSGV